jgi:hypothetical protein
MRKGRNGYYIVDVWIFEFSREWRAEWASLLGFVWIGFSSST